MQQPSDTNLQASPRFWPSPNLSVPKPMWHPRVVKVSLGSNPDRGAVKNSFQEGPHIHMTHTHTFQKPRRTSGKCLWPQWTLQSLQSSRPHFPECVGPSKHMSTNPLVSQHPPLWIWTRLSSTLATQLHHSKGCWQQNSSDKRKSCRPHLHLHFAPWCFSH